jgi:hypothetical protein
VRASSVRARRWVWLVWAICCSFARGDYGGPLSTLNPRNTHLGEMLGWVRQTPPRRGRLPYAQRARKARKEMEMGEGYGTLRLWSTILVFVGILGVIFVVIGTIFAVFAAPTFWQGVAFLLIGGPLAVLFASWPIALGQGLRALADVAEYVRRQESGLR